MDSVDGEGKSEEDFFTYLSYSERRGAHKVLSSLYYIVDPGGVDPLDSSQSLLLVFFFLLSVIRLLHDSLVSSAVRSVRATKSFGFFVLSFSSFFLIR